MLNLRDDIQKDFERIVNKYNPRKECINGGISEYDVLKAHYIISDFFISQGDCVIYGVKSYDLLSSAVSRQEVEYRGVIKWKDDYYKMATLLYGIVKNHPFEDGNKRTALLSLLFYFLLANLQICHKKSDLEDLITRIASNELDKYIGYRKFLLKDDPDINFVADKIKKFTRKVDRRIYTVTYYEFNRRLKRYGVCLGLPHKNNIKVFRYNNINSPEKRLKCTKQRALLKIYFSGWTSKVKPNVIKSVLYSAGLTAKNGIDSQAFFNEADPVYELIREYKEPLRRLKDK